MFDKKLLLDHIQNRPKHIEEQFMGVGDAVRGAREATRRGNPKDEGGDAMTGNKVGDTAMIVGPEVVAAQRALRGSRSRLPQSPDMRFRGNESTFKNISPKSPPVKGGPIAKSLKTGLRLGGRAAAGAAFVGFDINDILYNLGQLGKTERQLAGGSKFIEVPEDPTGMLGGYSVGDIAYGAASLAGEDPVQRQLDRAQSAQDRVQSRDARDYRTRVRQSEGEYARSPEGREHFERLTQGTKWEDKR